MVCLTIAYTAKSARRGHAALPPGANFIVTPLRWSACTAARGWLYLCIFGGWFAPYGIDQQFLGYQLLPPSWSRYGEVSFFLGTDDLGRDVLRPFTERSCANRGWRICGDACRDDLWPGTGHLRRGRRTASAQRCLTIFWIPYWRSLRCCWQLSL